MNHILHWMLFLLGGWIFGSSFVIKILAPFLLKNGIPENLLLQGFFWHLFLIGVAIMVSAFILSVTEQARIHLHNQDHLHGIQFILGAALSFTPFTQTLTDHQLLFSLLLIGGGTLILALFQLRSEHLYESYA